MALATLILRSKALIPTGAGAVGNSILFYMPKVWEGYVHRWVQLQWTGYHVKANHSFALSSSGMMAEADSAVFRGQSGADVVAIYDARYKWPNQCSDDADVYQMVAYCDRLCLGLDMGTLICPVQQPARSIWVGKKLVQVQGLSPRALSEISAAVVVHDTQSAPLNGQAAGTAK